MGSPKLTTGVRYSWVLAILAVLVFALTAKSFTAGLEIVAVASISVMAAFAVGALVGFLFGIPRRLQTDQAQPSSTPALLVNTNLEQISDWLTKIIVGVGLIELGRLSRGLDDLAAKMPLGDSSGTHTFALGLLIYSLVDGFLVVYIWMRLELSGQIAFADRLLQPPAPPRPNPPPPPAAARAE